LIVRGAEMKVIALIDDNVVIEKIVTPLRSVAALRVARLPSVGSAPRSLFHLEPATCALKVRLWTHSLRTSSEFNGQLWVMLLMRRKANSYQL
jgi:hypothetical protein